MDQKLLSFNCDLIKNTLHRFYVKPRPLVYLKYIKLNVSEEIKRSRYMYINTLSRKSRKSSCDL